MLFKELKGKEIIDKNGNIVGLVEDIVISSKGKVTHILAMPKGIIKALKPQITIKFEDIESMEDFIMLKRSKDELE